MNKEEFRTTPDEKIWFVLPDDSEGLCPECYQPGMVMHCGRHRWRCCEQHKTKWYIEKMWTTWESETEQVWEENETFLSGCREVKPVYFPPF